MKTIKFIIVIVLLLGFDELSAQVNWQISTETCNANEYIVKSNKYFYSITNKKYAFKGVTVDIEFDGEREDAFEKRREGLLESIYKIANGVFDFSNIPLSRKSLYKLSLICYFDSKTKDYVGVYFLFDTEVKNYITLQKLNLLENKLLQANINAGRTNLLEPNAKYFTKEIDIPIGK